MPDAVEAAFYKLSDPVKQIESMVYITVLLLFVGIVVLFFVLSIALGSFFTVETSQVAINPEPSKQQLQAQLDRAGSSASQYGVRSVLIWRFAGTSETA